MDMLNGMKDRLTKESEAATEMEYNNQVAQNDKVKSALSYLQTMGDLAKNAPSYFAQVQSQQELAPINTSLSNVDNLWSGVSDTSQ